MSIFVRSSENMFFRSFPHRTSTAGFCLLERLANGVPCVLLPHVLSRVPTRYMSCSTVRTGAHCSTIHHQREVRWMGQSNQKFDKQISGQRMKKKNKTTKNHSLPPFLRCLRRCCNRPPISPVSSQILSISSLPAFIRYDHCNCWNRKPCSRHVFS